MSKKSSETTIKTNIRIRPCSEREKEAYPAPNLVQAAPGEVRLYAKQAASVLNTSSISGRSSPFKDTVGGKSRPGTPNRPGTPPHGLSAAAHVARQAVQQHQLSGDYQSYPFANVFGPETGTVDVFNGSGCKDIVESVLGGCNGTIFVYGQTGAGKTYTMDAFTNLVLQQLYTAAGRDDSNCEITITISAVELYNEILRCLLTGREHLQLRMGAGGASSSVAAGVVLEGADERVCHSCEEAAVVVETAKTHRAVSETRANARSSRSHLIIRIKVEVLLLDSSLGGDDLSVPKAGAAAPASVSFSLLNLVDLAGSERIDKSGSSDTPLRLREALNINKSLLCLGNVVTALAERTEGKKSVHIPYRDSKLTRLLEDSLGGNAVTALLACITPLPDWHMEQTRATLEFAARAARVVCSPQRNVLKLLPDAPGADSSALIAALQAEISELKQLLVQHKDPGSTAAAGTAGGGVGTGHARLQTTGKTLQSRPWDSCSSTSTELTEAAALGSSTAAEQLMLSDRSRLSSGDGRWTNRLRLSIGASSKAAAAAAIPAAAAELIDSAAASSDNEAPDEAAPRRQQRQLGSGTNTPPRTPSSSLWKFFSARGTAIDNRLQGQAVGDSLQSGLAPAGQQSGNHSSLRSTGLLMLASSSSSSSSTSKVASIGRPSSSAESTQQKQQQQQAGAHAGMLTRWATFHNGRVLRPSSDGGWHIRDGSSSSKYTLLTTEQQQQRDHAGSGSAGGDSSTQQSGDIVAAGAAALALRDHIIKQLVTALQQKKAELKQLKEQQTAMQQQLEAAQQEGAASKQKLRELAEGIQALASAREEEFERWKGHLEELEVALHAAQQESLTYRQEALALVHQLTQLQSRYRSLQSDQLRRSTIIQSANQNMLLQSTSNSQNTDMLQTASNAAALVQQSTQLANCVTSLLGIEECLRQLLTHSTAPKTMTETAAVTTRTADSPISGNSGNTADAAGQLQLPKLAGLGDVSSHVIQTVSTRYDMNSGLMTKACAPEPPAQLEPILQQLQALIPLVKAAAATVAAAGIGTSSSPRSSLLMQRKGSGLGGIQSEDAGASSSSEAPESPKMSSSNAPSPGPEGSSKCRKCESIKPLLAIMQKLKDEVSNLRLALKTKDEQLAAASASSAAAKRDLEECRQQVGALQERIDELAEELEQARAAAAAAGQSYSAHVSAKDSRLGNSSGAARGFEASQQQVSEAGSLGAALSRRGSRSDHDRVPLMADDTPLEELHEQILLSWHALAMPRSYRTGFVLGHSSSASTAAAAVPWLDRQQCQAHIALLACLHQLHEDHPEAAAVQQQLLLREANLLEAGLARLEQPEYDGLCLELRSVGLPKSLDGSLQRQVLLQQLWQPCSAATAGRMAEVSAAVCQACFGNAPAVELAALMLASNSAVIAATSNALADAAS